MAKFGRRHYQTVALAIQEAIKFDATDSQEVSGMYKAASALADAFKRDNGGFKKELFMAACEPGSNVRARTVDGARSTQELQRVIDIANYGKMGAR